MQPPDASDDLVVSTPERVAFQYEIAGIGSRFLAQVVDVIIIVVIQIVITIGAAALAGLFNAGELAALIEVIFSFVLIAGYFMISEAAWNGQTVGKRSVRLRVVGDHGEPLTIAQAVIRNLVRVVDFLPALYAVGIIAMFSNRRAKRLGDFAAGTLVVRDRQRISLYDLGSTPQATPAATPPPVTSIWSTPESSEPAMSAPALPVSRPLDPNLRRLVIAYAGRRESLPKYRRETLAKEAESALRTVLPDVVASAGALAALDMLAEREGVTPLRPVQRNAARAMFWGTLALVLCWLPIIGGILGILSIVFGGNAIRAIRAEPAKYQGEDRAKTGRLLGIIGLTINAIIVLLLALGFIFRSG